MRCLNICSKSSVFCALNPYLTRSEFIEVFLRGRVFNFMPLPLDESLIFVGWGNKRSTILARLFSRMFKRPFYRLEDGFFRSFRAGRDSPSLSMVVDSIGIYYDSRRSSELENIIAENVFFCDHDLVARAIGLARTGLLSKYNDGRPLLDSDIRFGTSENILVVDQTFGDKSIFYGGASAASFDSMLEAALSENKNATIYIKTHPEVESGRKRGYLSGAEGNERVVFLRDSISSFSLIERMDRVYVVTSTMGFEALLAGKRVTCFGMPWYAGWGITDDRVSCPRRRLSRTVEDLFAAAYIHYARYLNPITHQRGDIFDVMNWLVLQRRMAASMHGQNGQGRVIGVGFRRWKSANLKSLFGLHTDKVCFLPDLSRLKKICLTSADTVVCWGAVPPPGVVEIVSLRDARLLHVEDGFLRSVGLGSDLIPPRSLVFDRRGIYFDATRPSDLEVLLNEFSFTYKDLQEARDVRQLIVTYGLTKYNLEPMQKMCWEHGGRRVLLVPGQVEDDASIRFGCTTVCNNSDLLAVVRQENPDAFIVYKPHPDVLSGNRRGKLDMSNARQYADLIEIGASVVSCIDACDEVHTMTSLTGFDALLRGKRVVTYGQPFYAGWGLTEDRANPAPAFSRRMRRLSLDELVAGVLLHYPVYWDPILKGYTTCEAVCRQLVAERDRLQAAGLLTRLRQGWLRRQLRKLRVLWCAYVAK